MPSSLVIDAQAVSARHGDGTEAFHNVTLQLSSHECVGLVGPNGAGKTSFLLACTGILPCHAGTLTVCGLNPMDRTARLELPRRVGLVMQQSDDQLFNPTVLDDVAFGPLNLGLSKGDVRERVAKALEQVKLVGYEERVPHRLSGGEKRRVALAGILAMQPELLLLDEPTQDLDPRGRRELMEILQQLPQAKLIASHDLDFISLCCPRTIVFDRTVMAVGNTSDILSNESVMLAHGLR